MTIIFKLFLPNRYTTVQSGMSVLLSSIYFERYIKVSDAWIAKTKYFPNEEPLNTT